MLKLAYKIKSTIILNKEKALLQACVIRYTMANENKTCNSCSRNTFITMGNLGEGLLMFSETPWSTTTVCINIRNTIYLKVSSLKVNSINQLFIYFIRID